MKKIISILFFLPAALCMWGQNHQNADAESFFIDAVAYYEAGDYDKASDLLTIVCELEPENDAAHYYLGECNIKTNHIAESEHFLLEAVSLDSSNFWYNEKLAMVYASLGKVDDAIKVYRRMQVIDPKNIDVPYALVNLYYRTNNIDGSLEALDDIESISGPDEEVTRVRYELLINQNRPKEAFAALEAFNNEIASPVILTNMGDFKSMEGEDSLAISYYKQALELEAGYPSAIVGLSDIYRAQRRYDDYFASLDMLATDTEINPESKAEFFGNVVRSMDTNFKKTHEQSLDMVVDHCIDAHPADSSILIFSSIYYYNTNRYPKSDELLHKCVIAYPDDFRPSGIYIELLSAMEYWPALEEFANETYKSWSEYPDLLRYVISAQYHQNDYEGIIRTANRILKSGYTYDELNVYAYTVMGDAYHSMGDSKKAYKVYDKALRIDPHNVGILNNYAYYLSEEGKKLEKAYKMSASAIEQEPDNATFLDTFGWIQHLMGRDIEARQTFKRAMLYGGKDSSTILRHYAVVLDALGDASTARIYYELADKKEKEGK